LPNLQDEWYLERYRQSQIVVCCGQGAWEDEMLRSVRLLESAMRDRGIHPWVDIWGMDVNHDWAWWHRQLGYYLGKLLD
jgi:esterase/lipase superfamily enzyme